jgi:hypothetical protein
MGLGDHLGNRFAKQGFAPIEKFDFQQGIAQFSENLPKKLEAYGGSGATVLPKTGEAARTVQITHIGGFQDKLDRLCPQLNRASRIILMQAAEVPQPAGGHFHAWHMNASRTRRAYGQKAPPEFVSQISYVE